MRIDGNQQAEEIKTIKPRHITLNLSTADVERITLEAARNGITVSELLEGFIGDLVSGTYSHGSDERMLASDYVERCCYSLWSESTFLYSLIESGFLNVICDNIEFIAKYKDDTDPVTKLEVEEAEAEINSYYEAYTESFKGNAEPLEKGLEAVKKYMKERSRLLTDTDPFIAYLNSVYATLKHENEVKPGAADEKIKLLKAVKDRYKQIKESED